MRLNTALPFCFLSFRKCKEKKRPSPFSRKHALNKAAPLSFCPPVTHFALHPWARQKRGRRHEDPFFRTQNQNELPSTNIAFSFCPAGGFWLPIRFDLSCTRLRKPKKNMNGALFGTQTPPSLPPKRKTKYTRFIHLNAPPHPLPRP